MPILTHQVSVSEDWVIDEADTKPASMIVQFRRSAHVLPWFRFVYAEGDDNQLRIAFSHHIVMVTGHGLLALLAAVSAMRVTRLIQPTQAEVQFRAGPGITGMTVEEG